MVEDISATDSQRVEVHFRDLHEFKMLELADPEYSAQCGIDLFAEWTTAREVQG